MSEKRSDTSVSGEPFVRGKTVDDEEKVRRGGRPQAARVVYGPGQVALYHAFQAYNSGRLIGDPGYADRVLAAAGIPVRVSAGGALRYRHLAQKPLVFALSWALAGSKVLAGKATAGDKGPVDKTLPGSEQRAPGLKMVRAWGPFALGW